MELEELCCCCLTSGVHKDMNSIYIWFNNEEVYSEMLKDCFGINLHTFSPGKICEICISNLRKSVNFKNQVLQSEQELLRKVMKCHDLELRDTKPTEIKIEPRIDSGDESDNYFLADSVKEEPQPESKEEKSTGQKRRMKLITKTKNNTNANKLKTNKIKCVIPKILIKKSVPTLPDVTITTRTPKSQKSKRNTAIKNNLASSNLLWNTKQRNEKLNHNENLYNILKYSNAVPFRTKNFLGFVCAYCKDTFPDPLDLRAHNELNHNTERLTLTSISETNKYNVKLNILDLSCNICSEKLGNISLLKDHLIKAHSKSFHNNIKDRILQFKLEKGEIYDCSMCTSTYETFKSLKQHMNVHYNNYSCNICDTPFTTQNSLNAHIRTHQEGCFKCDHCDKIFSSKMKKQYHEKMKHLGERHIKNCPHCNEPFRSYYQRNLHLVKVHNAEAQYKCNVCNKSYILKSLLMAHIKKNHLMERNCQCTECGYRFFCKKALKAHMIKHTGEKNYVCEVCNKSYARKYTLKEHMRIHNNDRRFKCDTCGLSFVQKCSLIGHLLSNHGISMTASEISIT